MINCGAGTSFFLRREEGFLCSGCGFLRHIELTDGDRISSACRCRQGGGVTSNTVTHKFKGYQRYHEKALKNIFSLFYVQIYFDIGFAELQFCSKKH